jgi:hypothetical protein
MTWRVMLAAALVTLTLGCDRPVNPNPLRSSVATAVPIGLPLLIVTGTSTLTTTVLPVSPLTVPRGSTLSCIDGVNNPLPPVPIAGTVNAGIPGGITPGMIAPSGQPVTLLNPGTFTFGCAFLPTIIITIIVV